MYEIIRVCNMLLLMLLHMLGKIVSYYGIGLLCLLFVVVTQLMFYAREQLVPIVPG